MLCLAPLVVAFALAILPVASGYAQTYPTKPIKLVVGQAPGGHSDVIGRIVAQKLAEILKQSVVIENRGGAGGTIGAELVARAPRDGYTLLLGGAGNLAIAIALSGVARYDPTRDFVPIGGAATVPYALAVSARLPVTTVSELVAYARAQPGRLTYGSSGVGSTSNLAVEWLKSAAGVDIVHVPYRGLAPAVMALLSGEIDIVIADLSLLTPHANAGTLRLLAATGARRAFAAPHLPTIAEQGIPGFAIEAWSGIVAPAGYAARDYRKIEQRVDRSSASARSQAAFRGIRLRTDRRYARTVRGVHPGRYREICDVDQARGDKGRSLAPATEMPGAASASPLTVGVSKSWRRLTSRFRSCRIRFSNRTANSECPPRSKKSSSIPTRGRFSTWLQRSAIAFSIGVRGERYSTSLLPYSGTGSALRSILPLGVKRQAGPR